MQLKVQRTVWREETHGWKEISSQQIMPCPRPQFAHLCSGCAGHLTAGFMVKTTQEWLWTFLPLFVEPCQALGQLRGLQRGINFKAKVTPLCYWHDLFFCPPAFKRLLSLASSLGLSSAPRGQAPDVSVWQPHSGPGLSLRIRGPCRCILTRLPQFLQHPESK